METESPYNEIFNVGDHLILELCCGEVFEGDFSSGGRNHVDIKNTKQHNNPNNLGGIYTFYRNEIEKVRKLKNKVAEKPLSQEEDPEEQKKIKLVEEEYHRLKQMCRDYVYLEKANNQYEEIIEKLSEAEVIGVAALGIDGNTKTAVKLLAVCTWKQVYLFDMVDFKHHDFHPELKDIFESEYICKVIHQAWPLVDVLAKNYDVYIQNIFDTQVVDLYIEKNLNRNELSKMKNLSQCLVEYLNFPPSMLSSALETTCKKWGSRPLSDRRRTYAAQLVSYLIVLKEQMHKMLFSEPTKSIENVHDYYSNLDCFEFSKRMNDVKVDKDIDILIPILSHTTLVDGEKGLSSLTGRLINLVNISNNERELPFNEIYNVGDHLILELCCGDIYEGDYSSGGKNQVNLLNTTQYNNPNTKLGGVYSFYRKEIRKIHKLKSKLTEKSLVQEKDPDEHKKIKIVEEEYNRLKQMCKDYIYLENADSRYYEAVKKLAEAEIIGVAALGLEDNRTALVKLLAVCTWKHVYLFDMINFKNRYFYPELKEVFESEYTCKVIHQAGPLVEILYTNYNVFTKNIFDTQVVDLIIEKSRKRKMLSNLKNLSECLVEYLNFPSSMLTSALETTCKQWDERPLNSTKREFAAQLVSYLIVLKEQMHKTLFSEVYKAIKNVNDYYCNLECDGFSSRINNMEVTKDIDELIPITYHSLLRNGNNVSESCSSSTYETSEKNMNNKKELT